MRGSCLQVWKEDRKTFFSIMEPLCDKSNSFHSLSEDSKVVSKHSSIGSALAVMELGITWSERQYPVDNSVFGMPSFSLGLAFPWHLQEA